MEIQCIEVFWKDGYPQFQRGVFYKVKAKTSNHLIVANDMGDNTSVSMEHVRYYFDYDTFIKLLHK
jgi:hypothetical protein